GDKVSILYDPGLFPALLKNSSSNQLFHRNGGVPQKGNLKLHLEMFEKNVNELIPDKDNSGLAIIDFESWRPVYRQNFGTLQPYKDLSKKLVQQNHPRWTKNDIEKEADRIFTQHGKKFILETLRLAKELRPKARWGYYGLPFCFNGRGNVIEDCEKNIQKENDETQWLYDASDVIFPSVYMSENIPPKNRPSMVRGRVKESMRLSRNVKRSVKPSVIVYHRYKFTDSLNYLSEADNVGAIKAMKATGAEGVILWGAWNDINTKEKCIEFYDYLENVLGPSVSTFGRSYGEEEVLSV
ncbi:Hyaluronidase Tab, partial [Pseudolycoriella hygida]